MPIITVVSTSQIRKPGSERPGVLIRTSTQAPASPTPHCGQSCLLSRALRFRGSLLLARTKLRFLFLHFPGFPGSPFSHLEFSTVNLYPCCRVPEDRGLGQSQVCRRTPGSPRKHPRVVGKLNLSDNGSAAAAAAAGGSCGVLMPRHRCEHGRPRRHSQDCLVWVPLLSRRASTRAQVSPPQTMGGGGGQTLAPSAVPVPSTVPIPPSPAPSSGGFVLLPPPPPPCPTPQSLEDLEDQKRKKKKEKMGFGSISRVFARGKQRKSLDPGLFDGTAPDYYIEEDADW